jgi:translation initiation factor 2B subunit (eIF-2B alpha/beta/delta family)
VDRVLRRELSAIARDSSSGAAELALRAVHALDSWLRRRPKPVQDELREVARALLLAQSAMAPLLRLGNEVALAADAARPARALSRSLAAFRHVLDHGPATIAKLFARSLARTPRVHCLTYSYSSTVVQALTRARAHVQSVYCAEGRPGFEGRKTARKLAQAGIDVFLTTDAGILNYIEAVDAVIIGADAILPKGFINKVGTAAIVSRASEAGKPVAILADTTKLLPGSEFAARVLPLRLGSSRDVWPRPPSGVSCLNPLFEVVPFARRKFRVLTERGWLNPAALRAKIQQIQVSPRLPETGV